MTGNFKKSSCRGCVYPTYLAPTAKKTDRTIQRMLEATVSLAPFFFVVPSPAVVFSSCAMTMVCMTNMEKRRNIKRRDIMRKSGNNSQMLLIIFQQNQTKIMKGKV